MTTEFVLLLGLFVFLILGAFTGDSGPKAVFARSAPRLGARVEQHLTIGKQFNFRPGKTFATDPAPSQQEGEF